MFGWFKKKNNRQEQIKEINEELDRLEKWKESLEDFREVESRIVLSNGLVIARTKGQWVYAEIPSTSDIQVKYAQRNMMFEILKELKELRGEIKELREKK